MFALLWRFLLFIAALWFVQRALGFLFGPARKQQPTEPKQPAGSPAGKTVKDPVCGMYLDPRLAVSFKGDTETVYFCSEECRRKFIAHPV